MIQRNPATCEVVAKGERDQEQQPNYPSERSKMQKAAAAFDVHEEECNQDRLAYGDRKRKDEIDARNRADSMVYQVEKMLKDHRDKISDDDARQVESALESTRKVMADGSVEGLAEIVQRLQRVQIENLPYEQILSRFDRPNSVFFLDPPYWGPKLYRYNFGPHDLLPVRPFGATHRSGGRLSCRRQVTNWSFPAGCQ